MLLVTGAASIVGRHVVHALASAGESVRAVVGTRAAVTADEFEAVELVVGDLSDGRSLEAALASVRTVVLISPPHADLLARERRVLAAAQLHRIPRVVKLSITGASTASPLAIGRWHADAEALLAASGFDHGIVRAHRPRQHLYAQVDSLCSQHAFYGCQGDGLAVDIDVRDVAAVIAALARSATLDGSVHDVSGAEPHSAAAVAEALEGPMGQAIRYVDCAPDDFVRALHAGGVGLQQAEDRAAWQLLLRQGRFATPTDTVQRLTGRAPRSLAAFASEFAESIRYVTAPHSRQGARTAPDQPAPT